MSNFAKKVLSVVSGLAVVATAVIPTGVSAAMTSLEAANALAGSGVIVDQSANTSAYRLGDTISREELSKVISILGNLTVAGDDSVYQDTDFASWSEKYAKALNEAGYAASNSLFNPKDNTSKVEGLKWVMEARDIASGSESDWKAARVSGAVAAGIATSFSDYDTDVTRGQVFVWAAEALALDDDDDFLSDLLNGLDDDDTVADAADDVVDTPVVVTGGDSTVSLSPLSPTTGAVAANKSRTPFLAIDVTAGSSDVSLDELTISYIGLSESDDLEDLEIYLGNDEISTSSKNFDSDDEAEISIENDTVIQAGQTVTLLITGTATDVTTNVAHQIELTEFLTEGGDVTLEGSIKSVVFGVIDASNTATLDFDYDLESAEADLGEVVTFADFSLEEDDDDEDVVLKSITFEFEGGIDAEDDIADLVLTAEGVVIASDLTVNDDDEVIVDLDYVIAADDTVDFELEGVITGSVGDNVEVVITDIYAIGLDTGVIASIEESNNVFDEITVAQFDINGAEFNISFDKSSVDEAKPDGQDVLVGTLEILADADYTIEELQIVVESNGTAIEDIIEDFEVDGDSEDDVTGESTSIATYTFSDLDVDAGVTEFLDITFDVIDDVNLNGEELEFTVTLLEVEDEDEDETYNTTSTPDIDDIASATAFSSKTIDIESASYELVQTTLVNRSLVIGSGIEVVLYQGKLSTGDASSVTFNDILLEATLSSSAYDVEDILQSATINIGGETEDADIDDNDVHFNSLNIEVPADSDNVDVLVTAILKDNDTVASGDTFSISASVNAANIDADDEDNEELLTASEIVTSTSTSVLELNDEGDLRVEIVTNGDFEDDIEDVVLAGTNSVLLAEVELEAEDEDIDVEELVFKVLGQDSSTTLKEVRLMDGATTLDTAVVTFDGTDTLISFEDFIVEDTGSDIVAVLVADLEIITDEGGEASSTAGDIIVTLDASDIEAEGDNSNNDIVANAISGAATSTSLAVAVVPVLVTASILDTLGDNDQFATLAFNVDFGNNDIDEDDLYLSTVQFEAILGTPLLRNDDGTLVASTNDTDTLTVTTLDNESIINDGDEFEFDANDTDEEELRVIANGFSFVLDLNGNGVDDGGDENITSQDDSTLNYGQYNEVN